MEFLEHVEFGEVGFGFVEIFGVAAAPAEGLACCALDATRVNGTGLEDSFVLGGEIVAYYSDDADWGEVAGC